MPGKTKTALAALFILGPVSVVVLAGPNSRTDDHSSVRGVLLTMSNGRTGVCLKGVSCKLGRDSYLFGQNEKCYWRGQCDIINGENTRPHD